MGRSLTRWLIPLPAIVLAFWPILVRAEAQPGLDYTVYDNWTGQGNQFNASPPIPPTTTAIASGVTSAIAFSWGGGNILGTNLSEDVVVKFEGYIKPPTAQMYYLCAASDDGFRLILDGVTVIDDWFDRGGGCGQTADVDFGDGQSKQLTAWYYENGGGAHASLRWYTGSGWDVVPSSWYTLQAVVSTTTSSTSTSTTTTTTSTSTTVAEQTTTSSTSSSTTSTSTTVLPSTTTTVQLDTTTSVADTTTTPTTTVAPAPTTTQAPYTPPQTTTSSSSTSLPEQSTTTTIVAPEPSTTIEETTSTTVPVESDPTVPESVPVQSSVPPTLPAETIPPTSQPLPETSTQETSSTTVLSSSTTTIPEPGQPISDTKVAEILTELKTATPAQILSAIQQVLLTDITTDQAVSIASSPEVLAAITEQQAEAIFEEIVVEELTAEVAEELVAVLNEAPTKVKKAFQETINVFTGLFDSFQMVGQTIPVGERRTLVAVSNTLVAVGASLRRKNN